MELDDQDHAIKDTELAPFISWKKSSQTSMNEINHKIEQYDKVSEMVYGLLESVQTVDNGMNSLT